MLIRDKAPFIRGCLLLGSFAVIFIILLMPIFRDHQGNHLTGLQYADNVFNELSKGSSNFIPGVRESVKTLKGKEVQLSVTLKKADYAPIAVELLQAAGATASVADGKVTFAGNLETILSAATDDGESLYHNDAAAVAQRYPNVEGKTDSEKALKSAAAWWYTLTPCIKELQKQKLLEEAKVVDSVIRRAIEPGNNFYSVEPSNVSDHLLLMAAMLSFYILYTVWYGFGIFELFEGIGLTMTKSKVKQEG
jgi:hypothetical protein